MGGRELSVDCKNPESIALTGSRESGAPLCFCANDGDFQVYFPVLMRETLLPPIFLGRVSGVNPAFPATAAVSSNCSFET